MSKLFGVSGGSKSSHKDGHHDEKKHHHASDHTHHEDEHDPIEVDIHDTAHEHDIDIGQIAVDVLDLATEIIIVAPIAGVDPSDIDVSLSRNILTLSGERTHAPIYLDAKRMLVEECYYGPFSRSIILPENLAFDKIKARVDHNTIMIHIPKLTLFSKSIKIES